MLQSLRAPLGFLRGSLPAPARRRFRPGIECLEGRLVPAAFAVTTPLDVVNPNDGRLSLREAVSLANARPGPDTIILPPGVYRLALAGNDDANAGGDFDVHDSTVFQGAGAGKTVIDGRRIDRVFDILGTSPGSINVFVQGMTIRNGLNNDDSGGAGIRVANANLTVLDCTLTGNRTSGVGGGISNAGLRGTGNVTVVRSLLEHNVAREGGGLWVSANDQGQGSVLTVNGSTVRRNLVVFSGGGIEATMVNLTNSAVSGNHCGTTGQGGGIFAQTATLTNCTVSGNTSDRAGGGIDATTARLTGSTVTGNHAGDAGGGLEVVDATLTNSTVSGNTAIEAGGGIHATTATLRGSTVSGNSVLGAGGGGGIRANTATLTNSTVSGNSTRGDGGGISAIAALTLLNVTVTDNSAHAGGGVFLVFGGVSSVRNSIIAGNLVDLDGSGPDLSGAFTSAGHNLIGDGTGATGFTNGAIGDLVGTADAPIDPRLGPLANNGGPTRTHALLAGSPAIDHGDNTNAPATDQRGVARVRDGDGNGSQVVDIGAFER
jgi:predicted outer membrane repeat protein